MSLETQTSLLDAAEALFQEQGFAATSLRAIAARANVNLAATHYHFGSKQGLLEAVVHRRVTPINEARLKNLDALEAKSEVPTVEDLLFAFLEPFMGSDAVELPSLIGRILSEPPAVSKPLLEKEFGGVVARYAAAAQKVLPHLGEEELRWRIHFLVGGMLQAANLESPVGLDGPVTLCKFQELVRFASAGFKAPSLAMNKPIASEV